MVFPRVLVVHGHPPAMASGTAVTLASLFQDWPPERLAQLHWAPYTPYRHEPIAQSFEMSPWHAPFDWMLRSAIRRTFSSAVRGASETTAVQSSDEGGNPLNVRLHTTARAVADMSPLFLSGGVKRWVGEFNPDIVYSHLGTIRVMRLARRLAQFGGAVLVPHFMDDWPATMYARGQLLGVAPRALDGELARVLRQAPACLCISEPMADEYNVRYGRAFTPVMNCIEDEWLAGEDPVPAQDVLGPLRFVYAGGLHLGRCHVLAQVARAMELADGPRPEMCLRVLAPAADLDRYSEVFRPFPFVTTTSVGPDEVMRELRSADVNVHVESFDPSHAQYTSLSISTKIPQYLACARPILSVGPSHLASMRHLAAADAGVTVHSDKPDEIQTQLKRLEPREARVQMGERARQFARRNHAASTVRARFLSALQLAVSRPQASGQRR